MDLYWKNIIGNRKDELLKWINIKSKGLNDMFGKNKNKKYIKFRYDLIGLKIGIEIFE